MRRSISRALGWPTPQSSGSSRWPCSPCSVAPALIYSVTCVQLSDDLGLFVVRYIGSILIFGVGVVYYWLHVFLSFMTLRQVSSLPVCWIRVICSLIITAGFIFSILVCNIVFFRIYFALEIHGNYHVSQKTAYFYFHNNFVKPSSILVIFDTRVP